jgi:hypothetical protein
LSVWYDELHEIKRGVAYTKSAYAYLFEKVGATRR